MKGFQCVALVSNEAEANELYYIMKLVVTGNRIQEVSADFKEKQAGLE